MSFLTRAFPWRDTPAGGPRRRREPVLWALALGLAGLAVFDWGQAARSIDFSARSLLGIAPFFLLAVLFAGWAKASGADRMIARAFSGSPVSTIALASAVGALSPFCSCGVIPLIAALLAAGVPLAPVMAFCIASPIMDPEMFILTAAGISFEFAVGKTLITIAMGLLAGFTVLGAQELGWLTDPLRAQPTGCRSRLGESASRPDGWRFWRDPERLDVFMTEIRTVAWFLGKWLTFAFFLESLMLAYVPSESIAVRLGAQSWYAVPLAAAIGVPTYLNGYAAIPLVSGLMSIGMSPGAAMAFVTAGAVSSIPAAIAVYALVRVPVFLTYLLLGLAGSVAGGYAYQLVALRL